MSSNESNKLSASDVASQFLMDYYGVLRNNPQEMHNFYKEHSVFSGNDVNENEPFHVTGPQQIETKILSLVSSNSKWKLKIETAHAQYTVDDSVLLVVRGNFSYGRETSSRSFLQTFVLARDSSSGDGDVAFYVRNDVFLFLDGTQRASQKQTVHVDSPMPTRSSTSTAPPAADSQKSSAQGAATSTSSSSSTATSSATAPAATASAAGVEAPSADGKSEGAATTKAANGHSPATSKETSSANVPADIKKEAPAAHSTASSTTEKATDNKSSATPSAATAGTTTAATGAAEQPSAPLNWAARAKKAVGLK